MNLNASVIHGFVGSLLTKNFDDASETPEFHKECWELCTSKHRYVAIAAPRAHAKTSAITVGYGLASLLFRERKFMLLVSDTETQAALFLGIMKQQMLDNDELADLFELKRDDQGRVRFIKDSETDIIVEFKDGVKFRIIAKGAEQKLRGLLWDGSRPDLVICDDMENDELVMNKDRREKMRRWFNGALLPSLSNKGVIRVVGTILHMDSLLERLMPKLRHPVTKYNDLKTWQTRPVGAWIAVKYRAHNHDFSQLLWPERNTAQFFKDKIEDAKLQGLSDLYSQEYLNNPLDESVAYFKKGDFLPLRDDDRKMKLNYYITADLAISQDERADYSVFVIAGVDENKMLQIRDVIRSRMDAREIVDTFMALQKTYEPHAIGVEDMQISKSIGPFLNEEMHRQNTYISLQLLKHGGKDKVTRARSIQARMRAKSIKFDTQSDWYDKFEEECLRFPRDTHDDQVDAFAYLGLMLDKLIEAPTTEETEEEQYQDELERNYGATGRSAFTGY